MSFKPDKMDDAFQSLAKRLGVLQTYMDNQVQIQDSRYVTLQKTMESLMDKLSFMVTLS